MTQAIMQSVVKVAKVAVHAMRGIRSHQGARAVLTLSTGPRTSRAALKQPTFNWKVVNKYGELINFKIEVYYIFMTKSYDTEDSEKYHL